MKEMIVHEGTFDNHHISIYYIWFFHYIYIFNLYMKVPQMAGDCPTFDHGDRVAMPLLDQHRVDVYQKKWE
jgi:hypothetical protein